MLNADFAGPFVKSDDSGIVLQLKSEVEALVKIPKYQHLHPTQVFSRFNALSFLQNILASAGLKGPVDTVHLQLEKEGLDTKNKSQRSALHIAAEQNKAAVVNALLGAKADTELAGPFGKTALHIAVSAGFEEISRLLLSA